MKKIELILFLLTMGSTSLFSQLHSFDISKYALPELKVRTLGINTELDGSYRNNVTQGKRAYFNRFSSDIDIDYSHYANRPAYQGSNHSSLDFQPYFWNNEDDESKKSLASSIFHRSTSRFFFRERRFYEVDVDADVSFEFDDGLIITGGIPQKSTYFTINSKVPLMYGFGRVEDVTDVWHSVRILSDLNRMEVLSDLPGKEQIVAFADLIAKRRYTRFFDSRLKRIEDIEILDDFLSGANLVAAQGSKYYTSLYDMFQYGVNSRRYAGKSIAFGLAPFMRYYYSKIKDTQNVNSSENYFTGANFITKAQYHWPINQSWQFDATFEFEAGYGRYFRDNPKSDLGYLVFIPRLDASISWYPNTRTTFVSSLNASYNRYSSGKTSANFSERYYLRLDNDIYYYLSSRTRLTFNFSLTGTESESRSSGVYFPFIKLPARNLNISYQLGFSYDIF